MVERTMHTLDGSAWGGADRLLRVEEAAERLSISRRLAYRLIQEGTLPSLTIGRCRRVSERALQQFIEQLSAE